LLALASAYGSEVAISTPCLVSKSEVTKKEYSSESASQKETKVWRYHFTAFLTNISEKSITVATDQLRISGPTSKRDAEIALATYEPFYNEKSLVIPSAQELRLIELRPTESAAIEFTTESRIPLDSLTVTYSPKDYYQGRFGYWTGSITSPKWIEPEPTKRAENGSSCKAPLQK